VEVVGVVLVHNEDVFVEQAIRNIARFCDRIYAVDHLSSDRTPEILHRLASELDHLEVRRSSDAGDSHRPLEAYAGTAAWAFGVDGDELYDPRAPPRRARGGRPRGRVPAQGSCAELRGAGRGASGRQGLPRAALASGDEALQHGGGGELDRLPRAVARRRGGVSGGIRVGVAPVSLGTGRLGVGSLRMLHTCFLPRSSADPSGGATSTRGSGSTSARARAGSRSGTHGDRSSPSTRRHFSHQSDNPESASRWLIGNRRAAPGPP